MLESLPKPDIIFTHESDLDGLVSGLLLQDLARKQFGTEVPLESYHNHNWRHRALNETAAWVADLAFEARLDKENWLVIDHHPTAVKPARATLLHDPEKSACLLCYELCREAGIQSDNLDRLVHLSNVADLFLQDHPDFIVAGDYANLVKNYQFWNLHTLIGGKLERLIDHPLLEVMRVKREVEDPIGLDWSGGHIELLAPNVGLVRTIVGNTNAIVHQLLERAEPQYEVLITLYRRGNGAFLVSLRSRTGKALEVARRIHGGGHPNASGATLPRPIQSMDDAIAYLIKVLNPAKPAPQKPARPMADLEQAFDQGN